MSNDISIEVATLVDDGLVAAIARLTGVLSSSASAPSARQLREIVDAPCTVLLLAKDGTGTVVGSLTLATFRIPTGVRAWIEDVVVDTTARGRGVGEALSREAIRLATERGARTIELTSRPTREAANRLYVRLGFRLRETNVYRYTVDGD